MSEYVEVISLSAWKKRHAGASGQGRTSGRDRRSNRREDRGERRDDRQDRRALRDAAHDQKKDNRQAKREDRREDRQGRRATYGDEGFAGETALGPHLSLRARTGFRAAISEIKPGLFLVAEVPDKAMEFGFGPLLGTALVKQLGRVFQRNQAGQGAGLVQRPDFQAPKPYAPGSPAAEMDAHLRADASPSAESYRRWMEAQQRVAAPQPARRRPFARWLDADLAGELGCTCEEE